MAIKASHKVGLALVLCYLVAWLDRMAISMTIPSIQRDLGVGARETGWMVSAFFLGYALFQIPGGTLADRFGPRRVILGALAWWSVFTALTGRAAGVGAMLGTRFLFGVGEGVFPASVWKVLGNWFTKKNRATANALVISSIALGPALTPWVLRPILARYGWRTCFLFLGVMGVLCLFVAHRYVQSSIREAQGVPADELAEYEEDERSQAANAEGTIQTTSLAGLLKVPIVWVLFLVALVANVAMYGWLTWLPTYLEKARGLDLKGMTVGASLPFVFGTIGCVLGGWVSDRFFRGRRKYLILACQVLGGLCLFAFTRVQDKTMYMVAQCAAGFLLFMGSAAVWALPMILLPTRLMGAGSGFINTGGQIGGVLSGVLIGAYVSYRGENYAAGFELMLGALALAALLVLVGIHEAKPKTSATPPGPPLGLDPSAPGAGESPAR
jgi:sugar phosphate permease